MAELWGRFDTLSSGVISWFWGGLAEQLTGFGMVWDFGSAERLAGLAWDAWDRGFAERSAGFGTVWDQHTQYRRQSEHKSTIIDLT